jgi:hypothetical protein
LPVTLGNMKYRNLLAGVALAGALMIPSSALAAAPWSAPVAVPGSQSTADGNVDVLLTRTRGGALAYNTGGSIPGAALTRSIFGPGFTPQTAAQWPGAVDFDSQFGSFSAADRLIYADSNGFKRVVIATATGPGADWKTSLRGPTTNGAFAATGAAPHGGAAAVFSTFQPGGGAVYLVRQPGTQGLGPTMRLSARGSIHSVAVAVNQAGDVLAAWDRSGHLEARFWINSSKHLTPVQELGTTDDASHLSVALGQGRQAIVAWVDQRVNEGGTAGGKVMATARSASRGFAAPKQLDTYGANQIACRQGIPRCDGGPVAGGIGIKAAYTGSGTGVIAFSGDTAVRAALVDGRVIGTPQDLAPVPAGDGQFGLGDLATSPVSGRAVVTWVAPAGQEQQIQAAVLPDGGNAFGAIENVSGTDRFVSRPSAAFDYKTDTIVLAWTARQIVNGAPNEVDVVTQAAP